MAYTAVISLLQTIEQLQQRNPLLIQGQTAQIIESLRDTAEYFQKTLEETSKIKVDPAMMKYLEGKIRAAANEVEDVVELKICQIKGLSWIIGVAREVLLKNLLPSVEKIEATKIEVVQIVSDFSKNEPANETQTRNSLIGSSSRSNAMPNLGDAIVGLDDDLTKIIERLIGSPSALEIVTISGMGGIGKTTLARQAYDHLAIRYRFDIRAWVTISHEFHIRDVLLACLHCISMTCHKSDQDQLIKSIDNIYDRSDDDQLAVLLQRKLKCRRYLLVVDDIWSMDTWDTMTRIFPDDDNGSRILLTTRQKEVAIYANPDSPPHEMNLLTLDESWKLLHDKVFGAEHLDVPKLEDIGKQIAEKCQGLPLTILVIAGHLSNIARTLESWEDVSKTISAIVASDPDKCLGVLGLSYNNLPNQLKPCFLSMGAFPKDFEVDACRLIQLWIAEGFIRTERRKSLEEVAKDYLEDLITRNLIMVRRRRWNGEIKACGMHDLLRDFCLREAEMTKFMHVMRTDPQIPTLETRKHDVRRFSFHTKTYSNDCFKLSPVLARSFYFFGEFIVPPSLSPKFDLLSRFKLLRVLDIFHHKFSSFPIEMPKLIHLRYLAVASEGNLPASISELQNLQTLIYRQIRMHDRAAILPGKIWAVTNLRHIHLEKSSYLSSPKSITGILTRRMDHALGMSNLEEFSTLCFSSCTSEVFSGIPNLRRLSIRETPSESSRKHMRECVIDMSTLGNLEALKCFYNPHSKHYQSNSIKRIVFPTSLKRLNLSGSHFPWEDISSLVMLPNLEELKLKSNACHGEVWRLTDEEKFKRLKFFLISWTNLKHWDASSDNFPHLQRLVLKNCIYLEKIPEDLGEICPLESIELHDCSTSTEVSARRIKEEQENLGNDILKVLINKSLIQKTKDSSPILDIKRKFDEQATKLSGMWDVLLDNIFGSSTAQ
ncbi:putative late blight resistance protein homolog R1A-3 [Lycium ferocissimum]|uniref:putative late blight resistance protein homolog R1A-3 n=1 Tax=Lycium ferocissimum TaxID=112874 RepID=UPI0028159F15|nr:putative late blight resistance protein homolog R1A-3 [Lycium ferocissimum]